jgi:hypothetical protein
LVARSAFDLRPRHDLNPFRSPRQRIEDRSEEGLDAPDLAFLDLTDDDDIPVRAVRIASLLDGSELAAGALDAQQREGRCRNPAVLGADDASRACAFEAARVVGEDGFQVLVPSPACSSDA